MHCRTLLSGSAALTVWVAAACSPHDFERNFKVLRNFVPTSASNMLCVPAGSCASLAADPRRLLREAA